MPHRLFIAVDLPEPVRRRLARLVTDAPRGVRPVRPEQIHLTLHFLGDVDDATLAAVAAGLRGVAWPAFAIDLAGMGVFPPRGRPAVLWAGVAASDDLCGLHGDVAVILGRCGLATEARPWVPHATIARLTPAVPQGWVAAILDRHRDFGEFGLPVNAVRLFESTRSPGGTEHLAVAAVTLGPASAGGGDRHSR